MVPFDFCANPIFERLRRACEWRAESLNRWVLAKGNRLPPGWFSHLRWPLRKPWQRSALRVVSRGGGIGDELIALSVLAEIKKRNPAGHLTYLSRFPELFAGMTCFDTLEPYSPEAARTAITLLYEPKSRGTIASQLAACVGLEMPPAAPPLPTVTPSPELAAKVAALPRPRVIIQPLASRWAPVKNWPRSSWEQLIRQLTPRATVIEVGTEPAFSGTDFGPNFVSFASGTSIGDFLWLLGQGDVFIGPVSGGMHVAAGHGLPLIIIYGGYEHPQGFAYPRTTAFYRAVSCAPCWLTTDCPVGHICMQQIAPEEVFAAVVRELGA